MRVSLARRQQIDPICRASGPPWLRTLGTLTRGPAKSCPSLAFATVPRPLPGGATDAAGVRGRYRSLTHPHGKLPGNGARAPIKAPCTSAGTQKTGGATPGEGPACQWAEMPSTALQSGQDNGPLNLDSSHAAPSRMLNGPGCGYGPGFRSVTTP